nr:Gag-Pol polyprotein [Tanacetum cinerariifolium]
MQTQTSNTLHNAIMEVGGKDRPPMLAPDKQVLIYEGSPVTTTETYMETYKNVSQDIRVCEMWKAIERLKQGESINVQDLETNLYWEFRKFTSQDGESLESYYSRSIGYENQQIGNVAGARETVGSTVMQKSGIQCYNCKEFGHVAMECHKPKWAKDATYHREKMLLCKQEEAGIQLNAKQADWKDDTDDESEDQKLEAHYMYMAQIQEVSPDAADSRPIFDVEPVQKVSTDDHYNVFAIESEHTEQSESIHDTYPIEQDEHNVIIDSLDMSYDREQIAQNDDDADLANERELLASLIKKLKCKIDDSKNRNKFLETTNKVLVEKLKGKIEDFKNKNKSLESSNNRFKEANNKLLETNKLLYNDFKKSQAELARRNDVEYASKEVEDQRRNVKLSKNKTSVTAWNDSLNVKTVNVNFVMLHVLVAIVLFIINSGCSKHMTGNLKLLINFVEKFLGTVKFRNDQIAPILGYGDLVQGAVTIKRVYYVEGLNHNLFFVGQFCDADLEVAFRKSTCYIRDVKGNDLLTGTEFLNKTLYAYFASEEILHQTSVAQTPEQNGAEAIAITCFTQNRSLVIPRHEKTPYHIINDRKPSIKFFYIFGSICYIVRDGENLDKMKEKGDACIFVGYSTQSRAYRVFNKRTRVIVETIHVNFDELPQMASDHVSSDLGPECQRTALKQDSLSPDLQCQENVTQVDKTVTIYTWTHFLRSKDETPKVLIDFLRLVQRGLHAQVRIVRTDKGTEFLNKTLHACFASKGILHQTSVTRTPEQNGVVERWNRTLVEAARTMLSAAKVPLFFWAEAIATICFTQNHSLRTRVIVETIHVNFDELPQMVSDHVSSSPVPQCQRTELEHDSLSLGPQCQENVPQADTTVITSNELDLLFSLMFGELLNGSSQVVLKSSAVNTTDAPNQRQQQTTPLNTQTTHAPTCQVLTQAPTVTSTENINQAEMIAENAQVKDGEFINIFCTPVQDRGETSSCYVDSSNMHTFYQHHPSKHRWTKDHPLEQVIGNLYQSVRTRRQIETDGEMCMFALTVSQTERKNIKEAMANSTWIKSMQKELYQFD